MSRIGKQPVLVPDGVSVVVDGSKVRVKGPKGELQRVFPRDIKITLDAKSKQVRVERPSDEKDHRALHGLTRALLQNMVTGVTAGYQRGLVISGVGYGAKLQGTNLLVNVGFAAPVVLPIPKGLTVAAPEVKGNDKPLTVIGVDKELVGQFAARIRKIKRPDPYKQKGIRYADEVIKKKAGKAFGAQAK